MKAYKFVFQLLRTDIRGGEGRGGEGKGGEGGGEGQKDYPPSLLGVKCSVS